MFTAYSIGVTIRLTNQVSGALSQMAQQFTHTQAQAVALQQKLNLIKLQLAGGALLFGAGFLGFEAIKGAVKPAMEYAHQLNIMNNLGMSQKDIAEAVGVAWKNTGTVITTTATSNLRNIIDLRNILADTNKMRQTTGDAPIDMSMAYSMLPVLTKLQAVLMASSLPEVANLGKNDRFIYEMAKTLDIRGAATDPKRFAHEADLMARAMVGMQGRITPESFKQAMIYARQEKFQLSDQFMYERGLPTLLLEQSGGGSRGVGPMLAAINRFFVQNIHGKEAAAEAASLGLMDMHSKVVETRGRHGHAGHKIVTTGQMKYADLALTDPYSLAVDKILPAILKKHPGITEEGITKEVSALFRGNQLLADVMLRFIHQQSNFIRDQQIIKGVLPTDTAYQQSLMKDPNTAFAALHAQWTNLETVFGTAVIPILIPTIMTLANALQAFTAYARESPVLVKILTYAFMGLSGALMFAGTVKVLQAAFGALQVAMMLIPGSSFAAARGLTALSAAINFVSSRLLWLLGPLGAAAWAMAPSTTNKGEKEFLEEHKGLGPRAGTPPPGHGPLLLDPLIEAIKKAFSGATVNLDGKKVGEVMDGRAAKEGSRPPVDGAGVNWRMSPMYPATAQ